MEAGVTPDSRRYQRAQVIFFCYITCGWRRLVGGGLTRYYITQYKTTVSFEMLMKYESCLGIFSNRRETFSVIRVSSELVHTTNWYLGLLWTLVTYVIRFLHLIWSDMRQTFSACTEWKEGWRSGENMVFCFYGTESVYVLVFEFIGWVIRCAACWSRNCEEGSC